MFWQPLTIHHLYSKIGFFNSSWHWQECLLISKSLLRKWVERPDYYRSCSTKFMTLTMPVSRCERWRELLAIVADWRRTLEEVHKYTNMNGFAEDNVVGCWTTLFTALWSDGTVDFCVSHIFCCVRLLIIMWVTEFWSAKWPAAEIVSWKDRTRPR